METTKKQPKKKSGKKKNFNVNIAVLKLIFIGLAVLSMAFVAHAMMIDTVLQNLENAYKSADTNSDKASHALIDAIEAHDSALAAKCDTRIALASYKYSKLSDKQKDTDAGNQLRQVINDCTIVFPAQVQ